MKYICMLIFVFFLVSCGDDSTLENSVSDTQHVVEESVEEDDIDDGNEVFDETSAEIDNEILNLIEKSEETTEVEEVEKVEEVEETVVPVQTQGKAQKTGSSGY